MMKTRNFQTAKNRHDLHDLHDLEPKVPHWGGIMKIMVKTILTEKKKFFHKTFKNHHDLHDLHDLNQKGVKR